MELKSLFSGALAKVKQFLQDKHFTFDQMFYYVLIVVAKLFGILNLPWLMVLGLPLIPPTYFKNALSFLSGLFKKLVDKIK